MIKYLLKKRDKVHNCTSIAFHKGCATTLNVKQYGRRGYGLHKFTGKENNEEITYASANLDQLYVQIDAGLLLQNSFHHLQPCPLENRRKKKFRKKK